MYHEEGVVLAVSSLPKPMKEEADLTLEQLPSQPREPESLNVPNIAMKENFEPDLQNEEIPDLPFYEKVFDYNNSIPQFQTPLEVFTQHTDLTEQRINLPEINIEATTEKSEAAPPKEESYRPSSPSNISISKADQSHVKLES
jgi:hypothetical protein